MVQPTVMQKRMRKEARLFPDRGASVPIALALVMALALGAGCTFSLDFQGAEGLSRPDGGPTPPDGPYPEGYVPPDGPPPAADGPRPDLGPVDPCAGLACTSPPAPRCVDGKTLERHDKVGTCVAGSCSYSVSTQTCAGSCVGGSCLQSGSFLHVDADNGGAEQGTAKAPYRTISAAIAAAGSDTAILVARGSYGEQVAVNGKTLELVGGYPGGSAADYSGGAGGDFSARDPAVHVTTIDGSGPVLRLQNAGSTLVAGFTITGGGRGVQCSGGAPTIAGSRITNNKASGSSGGGIFASGCDLTLRDSVVDNNVGSRGGGISTQGGTVLIERCLIKDNEGRDDHGGGMCLVSGTISLLDNRIEGNVIGVSKGYGWGGGVALIDATATLRGNVVTQNRATTYGSGVFVDDGTKATLENELYVANLCGDGGAGLYVDGLNASKFSQATLTNVTIADHKCSGGIGQAILVEDSDVVVRNSIFWNNGGDQDVFVGTGSLKASYTNSQRKVNGTGNVSVNPGFAGSGDAAYHLRSTAGRWDGSKWVKDGSDSPCLDSGDSATGVGAEPAPNGGRANLGAFGRTKTASKS
jgi:hypothetical protein